MRTMIPFVLAPILMGAAIASAPAAMRTIGPDRSIEEEARKLHPGDTLVLEPGIYRQSVSLWGMRGVPRRPITLRGRPGAIIEPVARDGILLMGEGKSAYLVFDGLTVRGAQRAGMIVSASKHIVIRNCVMASNAVWGIQTILSEDVIVEDCELSGSREQHGIYFSTTDRPVLRRCLIRDNAGCGAQFNGDVTEGGDGMITGAIVEDNVIHGNGAAGGAAINMDGVDGAHIRNNLIFDNDSGGITSFKDNGMRAGDGHVIANNTVYFRPKQGRFAVQIVGPVTNVTFEHNVFVAGRGPVLEVASAAAQGIRSDNNLFVLPGTANVIAVDAARLDLATWQQQTGQDLRSQAIDPRFADPESTNFTVTATLPRDWPPVGYQPDSVAGKSRKQ